MPQNGIAFGVIGTHQFQTTEPGRAEITRIVTGGVEYRSPPVGGIWSKINSFKYAMVWPGDPSTAAIPTLLSSAVAARQHQGFEFDESKLADFDAKVDAYLATVEKLHEAGWTQGLIHASSILFSQSKGELAAVLPDLGFRWEGEIGEPTWLTDHPGRDYWAEDSVLRQEAWTAGPKTADVSVTAKILAECVLGRPLQAREPGIDRNLGFWVVIAQALAEGYPSGREFRQAIAKNPASQALSAKVVPLLGEDAGRSPKRRPIALIAGLIAIVAVIAAGAIYLALPREKQPVVSAPAQASGTEATNAPAVATQPANATPPTKPGPSKLPPVSQEKLETLAKRLDAFTGPPTPEQDLARAEYDGEWLKVVRSIWDQFGEDSDPFQARIALVPLVEKMRTIANKPTHDPKLIEREKLQCLNFAELFLSQVSQ